MPRENERPMRNTVGGLLRRTGPASAELLDQRTGEVYKIDFNALAEFGTALDSGREIAAEMFSRKGESDAA